MIAGDEVAPDAVHDVVWSDGSRITLREGDRVIHIAIYLVRFLAQEERKRKRSPAQRRATRLLRSYLSADQRRQLGAAGEFIVIGSAGGAYRLSARRGDVYEVEKHGTRFFQVRYWCFHDLEEQMPPADETIGQLFHILTDEPAFREEANSQEMRRLLWDGQWLRQLNAARRTRANTRVDLDQLASGLETLDCEPERRAA